tara:strand:- start:1185 stop:1400 length:216 start_codon:yes stop_codon:yes gene_type:complete
MKIKTENEKRLAELQYAMTRWEASSEMIRRELAVSELKRLKVKRQIIELETKIKYDSAAKRIEDKGTNNEN